MRIVAIGGRGTIGKAVVDGLSKRHEVVVASRSSAKYSVDITSKESISRLFEALGSFDAVVITAGEARLGPFEALSDADFQFSLFNKLMGQVNVVRVGLPLINENGSFTLTSGVLATEPTPGSTAISMVNAGVEGFTRAAALEMPRGLRINVVSPPSLSETLELMGKDPAHGMLAGAVAQAYVDSVEGPHTGKVIDARTYIA